ncbi:MAG TPA: HD family phosphohydrolase, partial [Elusimicrobiota bacterium]|nr:HD family phosphohydrolase [Elusimicrobiota bacterium]
KRFERPDVVLPPKLLDGNEIMKALKIPPGPEIGRLMGLLQEAQAAGKVRAREEAVAFLKKKVRPRKS